MGKQLLLHETKIVRFFATLTLVGGDKVITTVILPSSDAQQSILSQNKSGIFKR